MAKLKATPKNYAEALIVLAGRESVRLGNNTYLETRSYGIVVRFHDTPIVKFWESGCVTLHTGGYRTVTTKERMNQFITGKIYQKAGAWFYAECGSDGMVCWEHPYTFTEGFTV